MRARVMQAEMMDDPALAGPEHVQALRGLARLNWWSGAARHVWRPIRALAMDSGASPVRVLDVACGGGDGAVELWRRAQREGMDVDVEGCDLSERAVVAAQQRAEEAGAAMRFFQRDVVRDGLPTGYDVITSSLFLHHLGSESLRRFLADAARVAHRMVVHCDLRRTWWGLALAHVATRALTRSPVVHVDGPRSVRAALSIHEMRELAAAVGMRGAEIQPCWPARFVLVWRRPA